tara:strand:+ start:1035 stop:1442 length:408 start_codon:yes stop_codon:yes gene_type:complete
MAFNEEAEQIKLCDYIRENYPETIFNSDHSGIRVGQGLANKIKKLHSENGIPDLSIDEPRGGYFGLKIELKATGNSPFRKTGMLKDNEHLRTQWKMLTRLCNKGYFAGFCTGYDEAKAVVDWYMTLDATKFPIKE